jgi:hypothetical protein
VIEDLMVDEDFENAEFDRVHVVCTSSFKRRSNVGSWGLGGHDVYGGEI